MLKNLIPESAQVSCVKKMMQVLFLVPENQDYGLSLETVASWTKYSNSTSHSHLGLRPVSLWSRLGRFACVEF